MFVTTLKKIHAREPTEEIWENLLTSFSKTKADTELLSLLTILEKTGFDTALWCCCAVKGHDKDLRLYSIWCIRQMQHLITDNISLHALDVEERRAKGLAKNNELTNLRHTELSLAWGDTLNVASVSAWVAGQIAWGARLVATNKHPSAIGETWTAARAKQEARFRQMLIDGAFIGSTQLGN